MSEETEDAIERRVEAEQIRSAEERRRQLFGIVQLGIEVQQFIETPLCARMEADAQAQRQSKVNEYLELDPDSDADRSTMRGLKLDIMVLEQWKRFFQEYVNAGRNAEAELREQDQV